MASIRAGLTSDILNGVLTLPQVIEILWHSRMFENIQVFNLVKKAIKYLDEDSLLLEYGSKTKIEINNNKDYLLNYMIMHHVKINGKTGDEMKYTESSLSSLFNYYPMSPYYPGEIQSDSNSLYKSIIKSSSIRYFYQPLPLDEENQGLIEYINDRNLKIRKIDAALAMASMDDCKGDIDLSWKKYNYNSVGHINEVKVLKMLKKMGYKIEQTEGGSRRLGNNMLSGKPDGIIRDSAEYGDCILEIKSKPKKYLDKRGYRQIYSYYYIYQMPVLLVNYSSGQLEFTYMDEKYLSALWGEIEEKLVYACDRLYNILDVKTFDEFDNLCKRLRNGKLAF